MRKTPKETTQYCVWKTEWTNEKHSKSHQNKMQDSTYLCTFGCYSHSVDAIDACRWATWSVYYANHIASKYENVYIENTRKSHKWDGTAKTMEGAHNWKQQRYGKHMCVYRWSPVLIYRPISVCFPLVLLIQFLKKKILSIRKFCKLSILAPNNYIARLKREHEAFMKLNQTGWVLINGLHHWNFQ